MCGNHPQMSRTAGDNSGRIAVNVINQVGDEVSGEMPRDVGRKLRLP
jgi:hypothetical protein